MKNKFRETLGDDMSRTRLGYYIDKIGKIEKKEFDLGFMKLGITFSQFRVLNWLWRKGELTQKELLQLIKVKPSSLTSTLNILIKKELVVRKFDDTDARVRKIAVTSKAKKIESEAWDIVNSFDSKIKATLTEEEYYMTIKCLDKLIKNLYI